MTDKQLRQNIFGRHSKDDGNYKNARWAVFHYEGGNFRYSLDGGLLEALLNKITTLESKVSDLECEIETHLHQEPTQAIPIRQFNIGKFVEELKRHHDSPGHPFGSSDERPASAGASETGATEGATAGAKKNVSRK